MNVPEARQPPEPTLEWIMLFPNGSPASVVLRSTDLNKVRAWAKPWPPTVTLHRRIVLEGHWFRDEDVVDVQIEEVGTA